MRSKLGFVAIGLFVLSLVAYFLSGPDGQYISLAAACLRVGLILVAMWLALPQLERAPPWLFGAVLVLAVILARWPKYFLLVLVALALLAFFKPRIKADRRREPSP